MLTEYRFVARWQANPAQANSVCRDRNAVFIDPDSALWIRWDVWEMTTPWSPFDTGEQEVARFTYDDTIRLVAP